jgi:hypothetical protein
MPRTLDPKKTVQGMNDPVGYVDEMEKDGKADQLTPSDRIRAGVLKILRGSPRPASKEPAKKE